MATPPATLDINAELLATCKELREALCGAMRVITEIDAATRLGLPMKDAAERFVFEMHALGIRDGFGVLAEEVIARAEGRS